MVYQNFTRDFNENRSIKSSFFQFKDVVEFCDEMAERGKTVIVAALDGTFQKKVIHAQ